MNPDLLKVPIAIQIALAGGYLAYLVAYAGIRQHHTTADATFRSIVFGLAASAVLLWKPFAPYVNEIAASLTADSDIVYSPIEPLMLPWPWCRGRVVIGGDAAHRGGGVTGSLVGERLHRGATCAAASCTAGTMFAYAPHRHRFPLIRSATSSWSSSGSDDG